MAIKKNIRNYTSEADPMQSIVTIKRMIIQCGAREITEAIDEHGNTTGIKFVLPVNNMQMTFDMQANVDLVYAYMIKQYEKTPTKAQEEAARRAGRTDSLEKPHGVIADTVGYGSHLPARNGRGVANDAIRR